jgi:Na+-driven multidrug efflux pump
MISGAIGLSVNIILNTVTIYALSMGTEGAA